MHWKINLVIIISAFTSRPGLAASSPSRQPTARSSSSRGQTGWNEPTARKSAWIKRDGSLSKSWRPQALQGRDQVRSGRAEPQEALELLLLADQGRFDP